MRKLRLSPVLIQDRFLFGWAASAEGSTSEPIEVHLFMDGRPVAVAFTGTSLPAFCSGTCGQAPHPQAGFVFALPPAALDGFPHDIHVGIPTPEGGLHGVTRSYRSAAVRGEVKQQGRQFVGTVWFDAFPRKPQLDISGQGGFARKVPLQVSKTAEANGYPAPYAVPAEDMPEGPLHFSCQGQALRGSPAQRRAVLVGMVEHAGSDGVRGWVFDGADPARPLELCLRIDGRAVAWFRPNHRREEIEERLVQYKDKLGLIGFHASLPDGMFDGRWHRVEVVGADDGQPLKDGQRLLKLEHAWVGVNHNTQSEPWVPASAGSTAKPLVSVVILNRNGAGLLKGFFASWGKYNTVPAEVIVIDHASTDGSREVIEQAGAKLIALDHNGSFSDSSNLGARHARGEHLLFMNNDIEWLHDALPPMLQTLAQPDVGIVGLKLLKAVGESRQALVPAREVQHLGVRMKLNEVGYWPYETAPAPWNREEEYAPQVVPAVTGAVLLCRKSDFDAVGGFDPAYFYGYEDVELCLRLSQRLSKLTVCRNDVQALHRHGYTRLSGRDMSMYERIQHNAEVLQAQAGVWIKQAYWRSLLRGDGYMAGEPLTIAVAVDQAGETPPVAAQLQQALPHARVGVLAPGRDWMNVRGVHVLVVTTPVYDVRAVKEARGDLLTVAMGAGVGGAEPGLRRCDVQVSGVTELLAEVLDAGKWRLRVAVRGEDDGGLVEALRAEGVPCWKADEKRMVDVEITVGGKMPKATPGVLNVYWGRLRANDGVVVTKERPSRAWLEQQVRARVGSTFHPS
jgi:GT2 family glycosyltransferase